MAPFISRMYFTIELHSRYTGIVQFEASKVYMTAIMAIKAVDFRCGAHGVASFNSIVYYLCALPSLLLRSMVWGMRLLYVYACHAVYYTVPGIYIYTHVLLYNMQLWCV